jgi:hypothetical protein
MEEPAAQRQQQTAPTVGEEAEVADAWEAPGKKRVVEIAVRTRNE